MKTSVSLCLCGVLSSCFAAEPIRYSLSLKDPAQHYLQVTLCVRSAQPFDLQLPAWNATYQVRDFAQFVGRVEANAALRRLNTHTWRVTPSALETKVSYAVFADRPGPFGLQLNERHAFLNFALCLMYRVGAKDQPAELRFSDVPPGWKIATALPEKGGVFRARNYDHLADSPAEISAFQEISFTEGPAIYRVVVDASKPAPLSDLEAMLRRIVVFETALMLDVPFARYTFLYHFRPEGGGGMEHAESLAIDAPPPQDERGWERLAGVTAHEFFHLWNVKRIRPNSLEPVDYSGEQSTRALWFSEGFTSTYAAYVLLRAGLSSRERFRRHLERAIGELEKRPAARRQSAEEASLETWFDKYPHYRRPERSISYYQKGELVGFLLDLAIRQATANRRSLDDLMRLMNRRYAQRGLFFDEESDIQHAAEEITGQSFQEFFDTLVRSAAPANYARYLDHAGFELQESDRQVAALGFTASRNFDGPLVINSVDPGRPAARTPLRVGDTVLEIQGRPQTSAGRWPAVGQRPTLVLASGRGLEEIIEELRPGQAVRLRLERNGRQLEARFSAGRALGRIYVLRESRHPTPLQLKIRKGWLEGRTD